MGANEAVGPVLLCVRVSTGHRVRTATVGSSWCGGTVVPFIRRASCVGTTAPTVTSKYTFAKDLPGRKGTGIAYPAVPLAPAPGGAAAPPGGQYVGDGDSPCAPLSGMACRV